MLHHLRTILQQTHPLYIFLWGMLTCALISSFPIAIELPFVAINISGLVLLLGLLWRTPHQRRHLWPAVLGYCYIALSWGLTTPTAKPPDSASVQVLRTSLSQDIALVTDTHTHKTYIVRNISCRAGQSPHSIISSQDRRTVILCSPQTSQPGTLSDLRAALLEKMRGLLAVEHSPVSGWIYALLTGQKNTLHPEYAALMRWLGISHLASVSGLHLTIILLCLRSILALGRYLLSLLPLPQITTLPWLTLSRIIEVLCLMLWLFLIAFKASAVRAFCCYIAMQIFHHRWTHLPPSLSSRLALALILFMIITPLDLFHFSSVLSWCAYLIICLFFSFLTPSSHQLSTPQLHPTTLRTAITKHLRFLLALASMQLLLNWVSFLMIGEVSLWAIAGNLIALPLLVLVFKSFVIINLLLLPLALIETTTIPTLITHINTTLCAYTEPLFEVLFALCEQAFTLSPALLDLHILHPILILSLQWVTSWMILLLYWKRRCLDHKTPPKPPAITVKPLTEV